MYIHKCVETIQEIPKREMIIYSYNILLTCKISLMVKK
nr:MAG TPA: hypothetical protein [Caudoviricetes sp.]